MATSSVATKELVKYRVEEGVAILEMNDPPANTYTYEMMQQLDTAILDARMDENVHVIVIRGGGEKFFSAGRASRCWRRWTRSLNIISACMRMRRCRRLEQTPKLVIAALNGHTVGGGLGNCDGLRHSHRQKRRRKDRAAGGEPRRFTGHGRDAAVRAGGRAGLARLN